MKARSFLLLTPLLLTLFSPISTATLAPNALLDSSGNGHTLIENTPANSVTAAMVPQYGFGVQHTTSAGSLLYYAGNEFSVRNLTVQAAFKVDTLPASVSQVLFHVGRSTPCGAGGGIATVSIRPSGQLQFSYSSALEGLACQPGASNPYTTVATVKPGIVYDLWLRRVDAHVDLSLNGVTVLNADTLAQGTPNFAGTNYFAIGSYPPTTTAAPDFSVYSVKAWTRGLTDPQIAFYAAMSDAEAIRYWYGTPTDTASGVWFLEPDTTPRAFAVQEFSHWLGQANPSNGVVASTAFTIPVVPTDLNRTARASMLTVSATYTAPTSTAGTVTYQLVIDGTNVPGCVWSLTRMTPGLGILFVQESNFLVRCLAATALLSGAHTWAITAAGTNPTSASRIDLTVTQFDTLHGPDLELSIKDVGQIVLQQLPILTQNEVETRENFTNRTTYTNANVNSTINNAHAHIDAHFAYTNDLFNATAVGLNLTIVELIQRIDQNVTFLNQSIATQGMFSFSDYSPAESATLLFFILLMLWCLYNGYFLPAFFSFIGTLTVMLEHLAPGEQFENGWFISLILILFSFWLQSYALQGRLKEGQKRF